MLISVLGWTGAVLATVNSLPQFLLVVRTKQAHGLSVILWIINIGTAMAWLGHGIKLAEVPQMIPNVWGFCVAWMILFYLRRDGKLRSWLWTIPGVALGAALILTDLLVSSAVFGAAIIIPQAFGIVRQGVAVMRSPSVEGVSIAMWVLQTANQTVWMLWGILAGDPGLWIGAGVSMVCALYVLVWRLLRRAGLGPIGHRGRSGTVADEP